jgi:DNA polymerase
VQNLPTFDLVNAGPNRRFTVMTDRGPVIVHNCELMLQYEGGVGAFITGAATYGIDLDKLAEVAWPNIPDRIKAEAEGLWEWAGKKKRTFGLAKKTYIVCDSLKRMWREAHPAISSYWGDLHSSFVHAVINPGTTWPCRGLRFRKDGAWLRIGLPSGRALCYASPRVDGTKLSYKGINQYSRKWGNLSTYSGKIFENVTQAVARDVFKGTDMRPGANKTTYQNIEDAGYNILLSVHDELVTEAPDTEDYNAKGLAALMVDAPLWAEGLPLAAAGFEAARYRKD